MCITLCELRSLINESLAGTTAFHTSMRPLSGLRAGSGMWFSPTVELARAYHDNAIDDHGSAYTYECRINGTILTQKELQRVCAELGIDYNDYVADMTANPDDASNDPNTLSIIERTKCDGFMHSDYDPRDSNRDVESIFIVNPGATVAIVKQVF